MVCMSLSPIPADLPRQAGIRARRTSKWRPGPCKGPSTGSKYIYEASNPNSPLANPIHSLHSVEAGRRSPYMAVRCPWPCLRSASARYLLYPTIRSLRCSTRLTRPSVVLMPLRVRLPATLEAGPQLVCLVIWLMAYWCWS
jgi:hypothetical protein